MKLDLSWSFTQRRWSGKRKLCVWYPIDAGSLPDMHTTWDKINEQHVRTEDRWRIEYSGDYRDWERGKYTWARITQDDKVLMLSKYQGMLYWQAQVNIAVRLTEPKRTAMEEMSAVPNFILRTYRPRLEKTWKYLGSPTVAWPTGSPFRPRWSRRMRVWHGSDPRSCMRLWIATQVSLSIIPGGPWGIILILCYDEVGKL
jgi:hypothetical protein